MKDKVDALINGLFDEEDEESCFSRYEIREFAERLLVYSSIAEGESVNHLHNSALSTSERVIIGYCPNCHKVLILTSDGSAWRLMQCSCGFIGDTDSVVNKIRYDPRKPEER